MAEELSDKEVFGPQKEWSDAQVFGFGGNAYKGTPMPGQLGTLASKALTKTQQALAQKDEGIDYSGINEPSAQAAYSIISKPEDRTAYLKERFGPGNVTQDSFGRDVVKVGDKKIAFLSREPGSSKTLGQDVAAHAGDVLPVGGMVTGAVMGAPFGPGTSIAGSALGGGAGTAANSILAQTLGLPSSQSTPEVASDILKGIASGAAAEALGQGAMLAGRSVLAPYKHGSVFGPWEANQPLYKQQMAELEAARQELPGIRPKVGTFAPNAPLVQRLQSAGNRVFGDEGATINRPIIQGRADELTAQAGTGQSGTSDAGAALSNKATQTVERAKFNADTAMSDALIELKNAQEAITSKVGEPTGKLAGMADESINASRKAFGDKASELYAPIDAMAGKPVVPTQPLKDVLKSIVETMPKTESGRLSVLTPEKLQKFSQGINELPEYVSFQQMQAIRSKFRDASDVGALDAGLSERQARLLSQAADSSFEAAGKGAFQGSAEATQALNRADNFYRAGMKRFDDLSVQALVKDASETGHIQPEKVAKFIATPGQADKLMRIKKVISPESFQQVGAERWKQMVSDSEDILTGQIDGKKLSKQLNDMGGTLDALYGQGRANEMRTFARRWAQLGGKTDALPEPGAIKTALDTQAKSDMLQKQTWMMNIGKGGPESLSADDYLTRPDNRVIFNQARQTFGENSAEIGATKEYLARKIFSVMEQPATKGAEKYGKTELMGQPLINELNRYGRPYLEDVFGRQWTDSAYNFARAAEIATRKNPSDAGAIVVAAYALKPFSHIGGLIKMFGAKEILSSPAAISYMTRGIEGGPVEFMKTIGALTTKGGLAYESVNAPRNAADYARGVRNKINSQMIPPTESLQGVQGATMQGVRG